VGTDLRAGSDLFGNRECALKEVVKVCAEASGLLRLARSLFELPQDLGLSQHHGIKPACDAKNMANRVRLMV
jgi:hypothetical protein